MQDNQGSGHHRSGGKPFGWVVGQARGRPGRARGNRIGWWPGGGAMLSPVMDAI